MRSLFNLFLATLVCQSLSLQQEPAQHSPVNTFTEELSLDNFFPNSSIFSVVFGFGNFTFNRFNLSQFMTVLRKTVAKPTFRQSLERNGPHCPTNSAQFTFHVAPIYHSPTVKLPRMSSTQFECVFLAYLVLVLGVQYLNIYKLNTFMIDFHLVAVIVLILLRRIVWLIIKEALASQVVHSYKYWSVVALKFLTLIVLPIVLLYSLLQVVQNTSLENLFLLCYPLILYAMVFGFTLNPYGRHMLYKLTSHQTPQMHEMVSSNSSLINQPVSVHNASFPAGQLNSSSDGSLRAEGDIRKFFSSKIENLGSFSTQDVNTVSSNGKVTNSPRSESSPILKNLSKFDELLNGHTRKLNSEKIYAQNGDFCSKNSCSLKACSVSADSIRYEAECLRTDFNLRMKQILFNSIISTYFVGFVPLKFTKSGWIHYDLFWSIHIIACVWMNTFLLLVKQLLPYEYLDGLQKCAWHLGGWTPYRGSRETPHVWSPSTTWHQGVLVRHSKGVYRSLGKQNVSVPSDKHHTRFFYLFSQPVKPMTYFVFLQLAIVIYELYILSQSSPWHQCLSMVLILSVNYWLLYVLMRDRNAVLESDKSHVKCTGE